MRKVGEVIRLPPHEKYARAHRTVEQQKGFALDEVEKQWYSENGYTATYSYEPYDIFNSQEFIDFKLCTSKSLTLQGSEQSFGEKTPSYKLFIYLLEEDRESACFIGHVQYHQISRYLQPSRNQSESYFCFLDEIQDIITF